MFGFALWDARTRSLMLERDSLGQKSSYWTETTAGFAFASEIKALLALPDVSREPDVAALSHYEEISGREPDSEGAPLIIRQTPHLTRALVT
jgi:asparagine synthetase B (glutamine-hydrolysing)